MSRSNFGHVQYVSRGKYRVFWDDAAKPDGSRHQRSKTITGTRDDAEVFLARVRAGIEGIDGGVTFNTFWALVVEPTFGDLASKTVSGYRRVWSKELAARIGSMQVSKLTWRTANTVIGDINAPSVQRAAHRLLKKVCNMAIDEQLLGINPVNRNIRMKRQKRREKTMVEAHDMVRFLASIKGSRYEALTVLEIGGGMRHEEASPILAEDVSRLSIDGRTYAAINIKRALVTVDGRKELKDTKNGFSEREAVLGEPFASRILAIAENTEGPLVPGCSPAGDEPNESWFANPTHVTRNWHKWCDRNGIDYVRFGDMRTVYSILHGEAGSLDSLVSLSMGHSDNTTRGRNYQRSTRRGMVLIADTLTDYLTESAPCYDSLQEDFA